LLPLHPSASKSFPSPNSGMQYTKKEIIDLCSPLKRQERSHWIDQLVEKNLVPVKGCMLYRMLQKAKLKILNGGEIPDPDEPSMASIVGAAINCPDGISMLQKLEPIDSKVFTILFVLSGSIFLPATWHCWDCKYTSLPCCLLC
jgi:hypothetical protein